MVGSWTFTTTGLMDGEPFETSGKESVRALGDRWIHVEGEGTHPDGSPYLYVTSIGFDPAKGRFVGAWVGSPMDLVWVYDGFREGDTLTLEVEGPSFDEAEETTLYRDVHRLTKDGRTLESFLQGPDGEWVRFQTVAYSRA